MKVVRLKKTERLQDQAIKQLSKVREGMSVNVFKKIKDWSGKLK